MKTFLNKLSSRKFLTCVAGFVMGLCMVFGLDESAANVISGAVMSVSSVVIYVYTEGKIDAAALKDAVDKVQEAVDAVDKIEE